MTASLQAHVLVIDDDDGIRESFRFYLEEEVERRTKKLTHKIAAMTRVNRMAIGRERRVIELK